MNKLRRKVLKSGAMALFAAPALLARASSGHDRPVSPRGEPIRLALIESLSGPLPTRARPCSATCCGPPSA